MFILLCKNNAFSVKNKQFVSLFNDNFKKNLTFTPRKFEYNFNIKSMAVNKVILLGNVGRDPEVRYVDKNVAVVSFSLATTERGFTTANGTVVPERTEWHNVVAWRSLAQFVENYVKRGSMLYVEGKLQTRTWEKEGQTHYRTEILADTIQLLDKREKSNEPPTPTDTTSVVAEPSGGEDLPF